MAIIWVDPYLDTVNGGIHGTTGSGSGTYTSPYSWWDMNGYNALSTSSINEGDEIRIKGLSDSSFWNVTGRAYSLTINAAGEDYRWYVGSDTNQFLKVTGLYNNGPEYYCYTDSNNYIRGVRDVSTWWAAYPKLDTNAGYDVFNTNYRITNPNSKNTVYAPFDYRIANYSTFSSNPAKVTAGWTSETQQNGITYIVADPSYDCYFGINSNTNSYIYNRFWVDCEDTLVLATGYGRQVVIFAVDLAVKALVSCNYAPSYTQRASSGQANDPDNLTDWTTTSVKPGRMLIGQAIHGAYQEYRAYALTSAGNTTYSPNVFIDTIMHGYYRFYFDIANVNTPTSDTATPNVILKKFFGEYGIGFRNRGVGNVNIIFTIANDFEYETRRSGTNINFDNVNVVNESIGTIDSTDVPQFNNTYSYYLGTVGFNYLSIPSRRGITNTTLYKLYCNSNSVLKSASLSSETQGVWFNELVVENAGETIDTVSSSPASSIAAGNQAYQDSSGNKFFVAYESTSNNAVNLIPHAHFSSGNSAPVAIEYKSPSAFSGKTCWRLFGTSNGYSYKQMYRLELPNFSNATSDYTFETFFNTTASPGVDITINLYVYGLSSGLAVFKRLSPTVSGTTISFSDTFSPGELKAGLVSQLFAEVVMTKTSTANCSVAFNNFSIT
jgi:hypothetical protein